MAQLQTDKSHFNNIAVEIHALKSPHSFFKTSSIGIVGKVHSVRVHNRAQSTLHGTLKASSYVSSRCDEAPSSQSTNAVHVQIDKTR